MILMNLAQLTENYDCLTAQVSRLVDTLPREEQITVLISLQEALRGKPRTLQAATLAMWLNCLSIAPRLEVSHA